MIRVQCPFHLRLIEKNTEFISDVLPKISISINLWTRKVALCLGIL